MLGVQNGAIEKKKLVIAPIPGFAHNEQGPRQLAAANWPRTNRLRTIWPPTNPNPNIGRQGWLALGSQ